METKDHFEIIFAKTYPDFTKNLVIKYSNLTDTEIRLCMFLRMGFSNKMILKYLKISSSTLANTRSSVRKKFGLSRSTSLTNTILSI